MFYEFQHIRIVVHEFITLWRTSPQPEYSELLTFFWRKKKFCYSSGFLSAP